MKFTLLLSIAGVALPLAAVLAQEAAKAPRIALETSPGEDEKARVAQLNELISRLATSFRYIVLDVGGRGELPRLWLDDLHQP